MNGRISGVKWRKAYLFTWNNMQYSESEIRYKIEKSIERIQNDPEYQWYNWIDARGSTAIVELINLMDVIFEQ